MTAIPESPPMLDLTVQDNACLLPAFVGWKIDLSSGRMFWKVCAWCEGKEAVEAEAERLHIHVTHTMCQRHYAEQIAKITGDSL